MPTPPLPASPCVRVRLIYDTTAVKAAGNRFYISYTGSAPTAENCQSLASDISGFWGTHLAPLIWNEIALVEVDILDLASDAGAAGGWTGTVDGTRSGTLIPDSVANNVEFDIARRYRGGKPRMYLPPGVAGDLAAANEWSSDFVSDTQSGVEAFFAAIAGDSVGSMGTLAHVNLSYYQGFKNFTFPSGREKAVPQYRATALVDAITGYAAKAIVGSQRRRRTATSP